jgi:hypothetical protein
MLEGERIKHHCPPEHRCWHKDNGDEEGARSEYAYSAETAAEKFAEKHDDEGEIAQGSPATICVRAVDTGELSVFVVRGEYVPSYTAERVEQSDDPPKSGPAVPTDRRTDRDPNAMQTEPAPPLFARRGSR